MPWTRSITVWEQGPKRKIQSSWLEPLEDVREDLKMHWQFEEARRKLFPNYVRYCSNYYNELGTVCDWCQSEERGGNRTVCWTKLDKKDGGNLSRQENSSSKKSKDILDSHDKGKNAGAASSSRPVNRRYKLLKDVMC
ncbi:uncharacterized protein LOC116265482 isoform X3 [Nymphaea colorata]|uniref:uncharacterized protein LOC116265482 isoform X3 n=1 Tax=Nymphaea colorata TaxID=210225 RepID=UPI00129DAABC|nr:uncharacterized protein LOC116265482 isoform X3 [Nymphaea colorata]